MNRRVQRLRARSLAAHPSVSHERSYLMTEFYKDNLGKHSPPVLRALAFRQLCERKTITIESEELDRRGARSGRQGDAALSRADVPQPR